MTYSAAASLLTALPLRSLQRCRFIINNAAASSPPALPLHSLQRCRFTSSAAASLLTALTPRYYQRCRFINYSDAASFLTALPLRSLLRCRFIIYSAAASLLTALPLRHVYPIRYFQRCRFPISSAAASFLHLSTASLPRLRPQFPLHYSFKITPRPIVIVTLSLRHHYDIISQLLNNHSVLIYTETLRCRFSHALRCLLPIRFVPSTLSLHYRIDCTTQPLRYNTTKPLLDRFVTITRPLHNHYSTATRPLRYNYSTASLLLLYRSVTAT